MRGFPEEDHLILWGENRNQDGGLGLGLGSGLAAGGGGPGARATITSRASHLPPPACWSV